jgi:hypothetical protein
MRSTKTVFGCALLGACILGFAPSADAQEQGTGLRQPLPAPSNSFELRFGTGYTQGFGNIQPGDSINSVAGAGIGLGIDLDYRIDPRMSAGLESQYQEFATRNNGGSRGLALNVGVTAHGSPDRAGDPWLRLGTGYRMLWDVHPNGALGTTIMYHGIDVATLKVGYDFRPSADVAIAPVVGADLQTFIWRDAATLSPAQVGTFIYAGIQGRFDTNVPSSGGTTVSSNR